MEKKDLLNLSDEELLAKKKELNKSKTLHALSIGILAGILIFGFISWGLSSERKIGFLIPMIFPIVFIYRLVKSPNKNEDLEEVLKERHLN